MRLRSHTPVSSFAQSEIRLGVTRHRHRFGLVLGTFVPSYDGVASVWNIFNLVVPRLVRSSKIRCGNDHEVSRHLRVHVAKYRHRAWGVELERLPLTLRPGAEVVV